MLFDQHPCFAKRHADKYTVILGIMVAQDLRHLWQSKCCIQEPAGCAVFETEDVRTGFGLYLCQLAFAAEPAMPLDQVACIGETARP